MLIACPTSLVHFCVVVFYRPQRSWGKVIFSEACVNNSVHRGGACMVAPGGMHGCTGGGRVWLHWGGHAWLHWGDAWFYSGACMVLFGGACVVLFGGACVVLFGGGCVHGFIRGACMVLFWGGVRGFFSFFGYNEIRSMSGRYASYWNAFLFYQYQRNEFSTRCEQLSGVLS